MIPPCLCNSCGISSHANLGPNTAWGTKAGVLPPWRCFPPGYIQIPHTSLRVSPPDSSVCPRPGAELPEMGGRKVGKEGHAEREGKMNEKVFSSELL